MSAMKTTLQKALTGIVLLLSLMVVERAVAQVEIDITSGRIQPLPIAITDFGAVDGQDVQMGAQISQVIEADLRRSGLFAPVDRAAFIQANPPFDATPEFASWRVLNATGLVTGRVSRENDGRLKAEFRLWDVSGQQQLIGQQYFAQADNWRRIAHIIADAIYERMTGEKGYFDTRVVFIDETGPKDKRVKRLAIMDQDGTNVRYLTRGDDLVLTPRFSPTSQEITYMSYGGADPSVYLLNIETGQREIVGNFVKLRG